MQREIKFRAWDGFIMHYLKKDTLWPKEKALTGRWEIMQYTGLKDRAKKEIYEGDIVQVWHEIDDDNSYWTKGVVEYSPAEFYINGDGHSITCHFHYNNSDRIVIGNIYENPELISK